MTAHAEPGALHWRKSSYSNGVGGNCLETATPTATTVLVRDSKRPTGPSIGIGARAWSAFLHQADHRAP